MKNRLTDKFQEYENSRLQSALYRENWLTLLLAAVVIGFLVWIFSR